MMNHPPPSHPPPPPPTFMPAAPPTRSAPGRSVVVPTLKKPTAKVLPPRVILQAVEGWGKTSAGLSAPNPVVLMAPEETGYLTLLGAGLAPSVDCAVINTWEGLLALLSQVAVQSAGGVSGRTLVLDAIGGFERLCHEYICRVEFDGDWGQRGFSGYMRGHEIASTEWHQLLQRLDGLHSLGWAILLLSHVAIRTFKNPMGEDFDRYISDVHPKTMAPSRQWCDALFFGRFLTVVDKPKGGRAKGIGGRERILHTQHSDAYDAKSRYPLPESISIPEDPMRIWDNIWAHMPQRKEG